MSKPFTATEVIRAVGIKLAEAEHKTAARIDAYGNVIETKFAALEAQIAARCALIRDGAPGEPGPPGPNGPSGPAGPPGEPGVAGRDGADAPPWRHRRAHDPAADYLAGDVVALDGGSWLALKDDPGELPGEHWALLTQRGKAGKPGEPGERGPKGDKGDRGEPGPAGKDGVGVEDIFVEANAIVVLMTDGTHKEIPLAAREQAA